MSQNPSLPSPLSKSSAPPAVNALPLPSNSLSNKVTSSMSFARSLKVAPGMRHTTARGLVPRAMFESFNKGAAP